MDARDVIKQTYTTSAMILRTYVSDLSDAELLQRPGPGCNHAAWQMGHLIASEVQLLESICPGHAVELPRGLPNNTTKRMRPAMMPTSFATRKRI
ncbi:MAG: DinB family protein [Pirellulaceae bacterium]